MHSGPVVDVEEMYPDEMYPGLDEGEEDAYQTTYLNWEASLREEEEVYYSIIEAFDSVDELLGEVSEEEAMHVPDPSSVEDSIMHALAVVDSLLWSAPTSPIESLKVAVEQER